MTSERNILQIISADGWNALYAIRPDRNHNNPVWVSPLVCWALVQEDTYRYVVGLDRTLSYCEAGDNFLGYLAPGEDPKRWDEEARRYLRDPEGATRSKRLSPLPRKHLRQTA